MSEFPTPLAALLTDYQTWLAKKPLAHNTRLAYLVQVRQRHHGQPWNFRAHHGIQDAVLRAKEIPKQER